MQELAQPFFVIHYCVIILHSWARSLQWSLLLLLVNIAVYCFIIYCYYCHRWITSGYWRCRQQDEALVRKCFVLSGMFIRTVRNPRWKIGKNEGREWVSEQSLTSPPTQYRLYGRQFYGSKDPTNSIKVLKEKKLQKLKTIQKKQTTQNTAKQNYPGSVASYDNRPGNKVGLFYNAPEPTRGEGRENDSEIMAFISYGHHLQNSEIENTSKWPNGDKL